MIKIIVDAAELAGIIKTLSAGKVRRAYKRAGNEASKAMRAEAVRRVRERKTLRAGRIRERMKLQRRGGPALNTLEWRLDVSGKPVPLADYSVRQTKRGVSVSVNRGTRKVIKSAFLARMRSGHLGVFVRRGKDRLPIKELFSSTVADVIRDSGAEKQIATRTRKVLGSAFARLVRLELAG